jgi:hypothetical protein
MRYGDGRYLFATHAAFFRSNRPGRLNFWLRSFAIYPDCRPRIRVPGLAQAKVYINIQK